MEDIGTGLSAKRWRTTPSQRRKQQRQTERNKRYRKVPVEVTQQPKKSRGVYVGRVSYEWKSGPKRGQRTSVPVTLKYPAKITIRGKDIMVKPRDGDQYVWGEKSGDGGSSDGGPAPNKDASPKHRKKEKRLRDVLAEKYESLISDRGAIEAGKSMAIGFIKAHNSVKRKAAKRGLAKIYGQVLKTNKAAHLSFAKAVKKSARMAKKSTNK